MRTRVIIAACACVCGLALQGSWLPEVPEHAFAELGSTSGTPQVNGFVFIAGRYISPPYTVTRRGNGIFINRIQVDQPFPWAFGAADGAASDSAVPKAVDEDGDFEEVEPTTVPARKAADIDDLFSDIGASGGKPAEVKAEGTAKRDPELVKREKEALLEGLERLRKGYEVALGRGDVFFFGPHKRVNGNYGTARTMLGVLPKALRYAQSPQELIQRLKQGGVFFIDIGICGQLYRNKTTFPLLGERLKKIEESEALEARRRSEARRW